MSRPAPTILLSHTDRRYQTITITEAQVLYQVVFRGKSIGIRREEGLRDCGRKYPRTTFPNPAHAHKLAARMNALFRTSDFSVRELV